MTQQSATDLAVESTAGAQSNLGTSILATKLAIPTPSQTLVPRTRLTRQLDSHEGCRLALVVAPAGWGKTSVVREWCSSSNGNDRDVAWVSLDEGDNDPGRFLLYTISALERLHPDACQSARAFLLAGQRPPFEVILTALLNGVQSIENPVTLVLDDYHLIEAQPVHDALNFLLDHLPPNLRIVMATRVDPPLRLSRMRVNGELLEIRVADLRFTQEEAVQFFNESMGLSLQEDSVARLEARTEGWIAGLQLAAISMRGRTDHAEFLNSFIGSNRYIVDYLFDEVLNHQPKGSQEFLLQTSILGRLCGSLCEAITDEPAGQEMLQKLEDANLFLVPLDDERKWYRYHHLFADVLRARLYQQGTARASELHKRAAAWFDSQEIGEEAVNHALASGDLQLAAPYIERYADLQWRLGEQKTSERWLTSLPDEIVLSSPKLCTELGRILLINFRFDALRKRF